MSVAPEPIGQDPVDEDRVRCFLGLPVPDHVRALLEGARAPALAATPNLTWTRPDGWHLTLAYLGEVPAGDLDRIREVATEVAATAAPLVAATSAAGRFGDHALWIGVDDDPAGAIAALGERLQVALAAADLPVNRRAVRAHVTLARGGRGRRAAVDDATVAAVAPVRVHWEADEVVLWRAVLGDGPARYVPLASVPLGPAPAAD